MSITSIAMLLLLVALIIYGVLIYNNLVALKHNVSKNFANIDVLLKQRHDELPKLVETCRQYMTYERDTLQQIISARNRVAAASDQGDMRELGAAETQLRAGLGHLFALAESYPQLTADATFRHLQARISGLESAIADRREIYNESVNNNNVRIEQFPDLVIARWFQFKAFVLLEFTEEEKADVNIRALFGQ